MTDTAVAADFNESLDIERNITAEVTLNGVVVVDIFSQLCSVIFRKISYADVRINARSSADVRRCLAADAEDVGKSNLDSFVSG